jgi:hypothetical protein
VSKRDLNPGEIKLLGGLCRAGEDGYTLRTYAQRVDISALEHFGYADWVDGQVYLVTEAGKQHFAELKTVSSHNAQ